jgi:hypothetical protein
MPFRTASVAPSRRPRWTNAQAPCAGPTSRNRFSKSATIQSDYLLAGSSGRGTGVLSEHGERGENPRGHGLAGEEYLRLQISVPSRAPPCQYVTDQSATVARQGGEAGGILRAGVVQR